MLKKIFLIITLISIFSTLFCFRYYDPQIARWTSVDPADEFYSPYVYCGNNPTNFVDPDGCETKIYVHKGAHWYGHSALNVNGVVYTYGRYGELKTFLSGIGIFFPEDLSDALKLIDKVSDQATQEKNIEMEKKNRN